MPKFKDYRVSVSVEGEEGEKRDFLELMTFNENIEINKATELIKSMIKHGGHCDGDCGFK